MCVLWAVPEGGSIPSEEIVKQGLKSNPDGAGVAWVEGGKVHWKKGLSTSEEIFSILEGKKPPFLIHARLASIGGKGNELTHPFPVGGDLDLEGSSSIGVIAHNGHWTGWEQDVKLYLYGGGVMPEGPMSDTRFMALAAARLGDLLDIRYICPSGQKVALLTPTGMWISNPNIWNIEPKDSRWTGYWQSSFVSSFTVHKRGNDIDSDSWGEWDLRLIAEEKKEFEARARRNLLALSITPEERKKGRQIYFQGAWRTPAEIEALEAGESCPIVGAAREVEKGISFLHQSFASLVEGDLEGMWEWQ